MTKNIKFVITGFVFSSSKCTKICFRPGLRPGPRWGSLRRSPNSLVGWRKGYPLPIPLPVRRLRRLELGALYGASVLRPPQRKILATPVLPRDWKNSLAGVPWVCSSRNIMWFSDFAKFQNDAKLPHHRVSQKGESFQLQGASPPLAPHQGLCPWTPLGALPPDPRIGSRSARSPCVRALAPPN